MSPQDEKKRTAPRKECVSLPGESSSLETDENRIEEEETIIYMLFVFVFKNLILMKIVWSKHPKKTIKDNFTE